jgi:hypothetical protein
MKTLFLLLATLTSSQVFSADFEIPPFSQRYLVECVEDNELSYSRSDRLKSYLFSYFSPSCSMNDEESFELSYHVHYSLCEKSGNLYFVRGVSEEELIDELNVFAPRVQVEDIGSKIWRKGAMSLFGHPVFKDAGFVFDEEATALRVVSKRTFKGKVKNLLSRKLYKSFNAGEQVGVTLQIADALKYDFPASFNDNTTSSVPVFEIECKVKKGEKLGIVTRDFVRVQ